MVTSDKKTAAEYADKLTRYSFIYLAAAIFCALFGAVYEFFSHGVFSFFMIYAFAIPLAAGTFPLLWIALRTRKHIGNEAGRNNDGWDDDGMSIYDLCHNEVETDIDTPKRMFHFPGSVELNAWGSGIAAMTMGSIFRGVLDIYGTTNKLVIVYPVVGTVMMTFGLVSFIMGRAAIHSAAVKKAA